MRLSFHLFLMLCIACTSASCQKKLHKVSVSFTQPYCGGARPTPEMEAEALKPKPFSGKTLVVVSGKGKADSVKTDANGIFKLKLAPGNYKVYQTWKYYKTTPSGEALSYFDKSCLESEYAKPDLELTITKSKVLQKSGDPILLPCYGRENCRTNKMLPE